MKPPDDRLEAIRARIQQALKRSGRAGPVRILAATKGRSPAEIRAALEAGIDLIGENIVQEAAAKFPALPPVERHFIGHLQTNKVKKALTLFDCVQSVDSWRLALKLEREAAKAGRRLPVLLEVNPAGEAGKFGLPPEETLALAREVTRLEHLSLQGLMALAPYAEDPEAARPHFRTVRRLFEELARLPGAEAHLLSLGMSHDFEIAVEEGANLVRLGTALFGPRPSGTR